jgi:hypothetical protein
LTIKQKKNEKKRRRRLYERDSKGMKKEKKIKRG